jgi:hypothetical protein
MLVTVERVTNIRQHNFDHLEICTVSGEDVVVGKGEFKENDLCVYFRAGALIPTNSVRSPYLEKFKVTVNKKLGFQGFRIKPMKFKVDEDVVISHGIAFTLGQFYHMIKRSGFGQFFSSKEQIINRRSYRAMEHDDLTNVVGAFAYNPNGRYLSSQYNPLMK